MCILLDALYSYYSTYALSAEIGVPISQGFAMQDMQDRAGTR